MAYDEESGSLLAQQLQRPADSYTRVGDDAERAAWDARKMQANVAKGPYFTPFADMHPADQEAMLRSNLSRSSPQALAQMDMQKELAQRHLQFEMSKAQMENDRAKRAEHAGFVNAFFSNPNSRPEDFNKILATREEAIRGFDQQGKIAPTIPQGPMAPLVKTPYGLGPDQNWKAPAVAAGANPPSPYGTIGTKSAYELFNKATPGGDFTIAPTDMSNALENFSNNSDSAKYNSMIGRPKDLEELANVLNQKFPGKQEEFAKYLGEHAGNLQKVNELTPELTGNLRYQLGNGRWNSQQEIDSGRVVPYQMPWFDPSNASRVKSKEVLKRLSPLYDAWLKSQGKTAPPPPSVQPSGIIRENMFLSPNMYSPLGS